MGHSVHPVGFRLSHRKSWNHLLPVSSTALLFSALQAELFLVRWLAIFGLLLNSCSSFSTPFGRFGFKASIYSSSFGRLQQFLFRKRSIFHPLRSRSAPSSPPPLLMDGGRRFIGRAWRAAGPSSVLLGSVAKLLSVVGPRPGPIDLSLVPPNRLSGKLLAKLLSIRLRTGAPLPKFANRFLSLLFGRFSKSILLGLFVGARGRFTRSQMATSSAFRRGRTPFSSVSAAISFGSVSVPLKYGVCTISFSIIYKSPYVSLPPPQQRRPPTYPIKVPRNRF